MRVIDLTGQRFGRLTAISYFGGKWDCACECGARVWVKTVNLTDGNSKSCGCLKRELGVMKVKHGMSHAPEYSSWESMKDRCTNENCPAYAHYGGRGIGFIDRWKSFECFYEDLGPRPGPGYSLDRIDVNGNYEPGNCRWATTKEQQRNRRDNVVMTYCGVTAALSELCERFGVNCKNVARRIREGASVETAMQAGRVPRGTMKKELKEKE